MPQPTENNNESTIQQVAGIYEPWEHASINGLNNTFLETIDTCIASSNSFPIDRITSLIEAHFNNLNIRTTKLYESYEEHNQSHSIRLNNLKAENNKAEQAMLKLIRETPQQNGNSLLHSLKEKMTEHLQSYKDRRVDYNSLTGPSLKFNGDTFYPLFVGETYRPHGGYVIFPRDILTTSFNEAIKQLESCKPPPSIDTIQAITEAHFKNLETSLILPAYSKPSRNILENLNREYQLKIEADLQKTINKEKDPLPALKTTMAEYNDKESVIGSILGYKDDRTSDGKNRFGQQNDRDYLSDGFLCFFKGYHKNDKVAAVDELMKAIKGEPNNVLDHLGALRNGHLGSRIRSQVKNGNCNTIAGESCKTVKEFISALHNKTPRPENSQANQL